MSDSSADRDPLDRLAEEFVARFRAGERPSLTEYAARLPDRADEVRDLFPALVEMEQLKPATGDHTGDFATAPEPSDPVRVGEFRILRRVGQGGMGVVFEAVQESLGRHVALKLLPAEALLDPKRLERFRREAKSAAKLHHTNIVPVFGTGEADGRHYYAMQFISGHPLDAVIDEVRRLKEKSGAVAPVPSDRAVSVVAHALVTGTFVAESDSPSSLTITHAPTPLDSRTLPTPPSGAVSDTGVVSSPSFSGGGTSYWATVARVGAQVSDALAYAHQQGVQHRDIKPANLLLDLKGMVWVTDFGLAKSADADDLTHTGDVLGTLRYMAPERFDGAGDERADIYALGLTLYELLTLTPAFASDRRAKLIEQVLAANPPRPRSINGAIPRDLETIVLKAIARDPAMRYQTAGELRDDLQRYLEGRTISARRASTVERVWRAAKRNPAIASLLLASVFLLIAGTAVSLTFAFQASARESEAKQSQEKAEIAEKQASDRAAEIAVQQTATRRLLYGSRINLASVAAAEYRIPRLRELLADADDPEFRGWEWHYLNRPANPPTKSMTIDAAGLKEFQQAIDAPMGENDFAMTGFMNGQFSADGRQFVIPPFAAGYGRSKPTPGAVYDLTTGKWLRMLPPPASGVPNISLHDETHAFAVERRESVPLPDGVAGPPAPPPDYRIRATSLATGAEVLSPVDFPPLLRTDDGGYFKLTVALSEDKSRLVALSPVPPVAYIWRKATGKVEARRLAPFEEKKPEVPKPGEGVPWHLWLLTRDGKTAVGFIQQQTKEPADPHGSSACRVEVHDLDGPGKPPTILEGATLTQAMLMGFHHHEAIGPVVPVLDGEAGRAVRLLDTRKKQWVGRWVIPSNIPLAWDTQSNSMMKLHASDDGRRVVLEAGNGLVLIGERVEQEQLASKAATAPAEVWRTAVFPKPSSNEIGWGPSWFSPDGTRYAVQDTNFSNTEVASKLKALYQVLELSLSALPGYGPTLPETLEVGGVKCSRVANLRTGDLDTYAGNTTPAKAGDPVDCVLAVRNWKSGKLVRQVKFQPGPDVTRFSAMQVYSVSADGKRALVSIANGPQVAGGFGPDGQVPELPKVHTYLIALDRAEKPVVKSFAAGVGVQLSPGGKWLLETVYDGDPPPRPGPGNPRPPQKPFRYRLHSAETGEPAGMLPADSDSWKDFQIGQVIWTPEEDRVIVRCSPRQAEGKPPVEKPISLRAYDVRTGQELWRWECPKTGVEDAWLNGTLGYRSPQIHADGRTLPFQYRGTDGEVILWLIDVRTGKPERELRWEPDAQSRASAGTWGSGLSFPRVAIGPDGQVATIGFREVLFWSATGQAHRLKGHEQQIIVGLFSPDGKRLFTVDANQQGTRTVRVWDPFTARELLTIREPTAAAKVHCSCEDVPSNLRFEGDKLLMDSPGVSLVFDGTPLPEKK